MKHFFHVFLTVMMVAGVLFVTHGAHARAAKQDGLHEPMIRIYDKDGNQKFVPKEEWRTKILPRLFKKHRKDPQLLYSDIVHALEDGFFKETLKPSERLIEIDPEPERSLTIRGIVLMKNGRSQEAVALYEEYVEKKGRTGVMLTNLAKAYANVGATDRANETLWEALELDPNQEHGLAWWVALASERGNNEHIEGLKKLSELEGSWRPHTWLAGVALDQGNLEQAMTYYEAALTSGNNHSDILIDISGQLGKRGHVQTVIDVVSPVYDPEVHGVWPGLNLLMAYEDAGKLSESRQLLTRLKRLNPPSARPDLVEHFQYHESIVSKMASVN